MHSANASVFIAARQRMVCQFSLWLARIICVVCIVNIAAQKSALNTWICVIVRRTGESALAGAAKLDASGAETVAAMSDSCAAMRVLPGKVNGRIMRWPRAVRCGARCAGDERTGKRDG
jgi:hypothetical protein